MGAVFPDNVVSDGTETRPPSQLPNSLEKLGIQWQSKAIVLLSLKGQAVHLPAAKLPAMSQKTLGKQKAQSKSRRGKRRTIW